MDGQERHAALGRVIARAWSDEEFKGRLVSEPKAVLAEEGIEVPEGASVRVVEDSENERTLVIPPAPGEEEISDEALEGVAAGDWTMLCSGSA